MLRICTNNKNSAAPPDYFTALTHSLDGRAYFHNEDTHTLIFTNATNRISVIRADS